MTFSEKLQEKINVKTKPLGSLGKLESLALQIGTLQQSLHPELKQPHILVFAADHGIATAGTSAYPQEVTRQMVLNFLQGGAAINVFARQHRMTLKIINAGVKGRLPAHPQLVNAKVGAGTQNFLHGPAMTSDQLQQCLEMGKARIEEVKRLDCNVIGFGEMGIGNTSSASLMMSMLGEIPLSDCIGRGTGLNAQQIKRKQNILEKAYNLHASLKDPLQILQYVGGFEIAQICGAMLEADQQNLLILVDGFIASAASWVALQINPDIRTKLVFCHLSNEHGHTRMLETMQVEPLLHLNLRLGEGTGCALAYPVLQSAVAFLKEMASFESAGVSSKNDL